MIERGVWRKTDRKKIPNNRRLIGNKWVFKIKRDGTYRARLVALGYSQIPGVDYTDNFAPVAHDVSFRIELARMMVEKLDSLVMDVETAFLYGDIKEEILTQDHHQKIAINSKRGSMYCAKQQDNYGKSLWKQLRKNLLDSQLVQQIHACYSKKTILEYA